jgi:hypothetical protein
MRDLLGTILAGFAALGYADFNQIVQQNSPAVVFLEVVDGKGQSRDSGTGFIVSPDGYVVTVAHIKAKPDEQMWAVIGERSGTPLRLQPREVDDQDDVALWQLPQSVECRHTVILSTETPKYPEAVLALGFPRAEGLTSLPMSIVNSGTRYGFYKSDGALDHGDSGGPVFNKDGKVIAIVQGGGIPGTANNDLIPVSIAISLLKKRNVRVGIDGPVSCKGPQTKFPDWSSLPLVTAFPSPPFSCNCVRTEFEPRDSFPLVNGFHVAPSNTMGKVTNGCPESVKILFMKSTNSLIDPNTQPPPNEPFGGRFYALAELEPEDQAVVDISGSSDGAALFLSCPVNYRHVSAP